MLTEIGEERAANADDVLYRAKGRRDHLNSVKTGHLRRS